MSEEFSFVSEGLGKARQGDASRAEIRKVITDFKSAVKDACMQECNVMVSFDTLLFGTKLSSLGIESKLLSAGTVTAHLRPFVPGFDLFSYEMDPVNGYPVIVKYGMRNVRCADKRDLIAGIKAAYENRVGDLREWCESYGMSFANPRNILSTATLSGM